MYIPCSIITRFATPRVAYSIHIHGFADFADTYSRFRSLQSGILALRVNSLLATVINMYITTAVTLMVSFTKCDMFNTNTIYICFL